MTLLSLAVRLPELPVLGPLQLLLSPRILTIPFWTPYDGKSSRPAVEPGTHAQGEASRSDASREANRMDLPPRRK
ncbi:Phosphatidylinositol 3,4,5-trisphosphate 3-phosphatase and dual-specificity protein phosphatase, partial [Clarias magur]